jgi:hypothetical protein
MKSGLPTPNITPHHQRNDHNAQVWAEETRLLATPLAEISSGAELAMLGRLLADEDHLMIMLGTCPRHERAQKFEAMRPYFRFKAQSYGTYELRRIERDFNKFTRIQNQPSQQKTIGG